MSKDIVDRLRSGQPMGPDDVRFDAAREIERLREWNTKLTEKDAEIERMRARYEKDWEKLRCPTEMPEYP